VLLFSFFLFSCSCGGWVPRGYLKYRIYWKNGKIVNFENLKISFCGVCSTGGLPAPRKAAASRPSRPGTRCWVSDRVFCIIVLWRVRAGGKLMKSRFPSTGSPRGFQTMAGSSAGGTRQRADAWMPILWLNNVNCNLAENRKLQVAENRENQKLHPRRRLRKEGAEDSLKRLRRREELAYASFLHTDLREALQLSFSSCKGGWKSPNLLQKPIKFLLRLCQAALRLMTVCRIARAVGQPSRPPNRGEWGPEVSVGF